MNPLIGIALKLVSALTFTLMSACVKLIALNVTTGQIVFFRSFFALIPLLLWLSWNGSLKSSIRTNNLMGHIKRGLIGSGGMFFGFIGISYIPLIDATAIGYTTPLITVLLAALVLKEKVSKNRWLAVGGGFIGVLIMMSPHINNSVFFQSLMGATSHTQQTTANASAMFGALMTLTGAFCAAGAYTQVRQLIRTEPTGAIVFYFTLLTTLMGLLTFFTGWNPTTQSDLIILITIGLLGGIGQITMTQSFRYTDASSLAPFDYTTMIWASLLGWLIFGEWPEKAVLIGGLLVAACGIFVIYQERKTAKSIDMRTNLEG